MKWGCILIATLLLAGCATLVSYTNAPLATYDKDTKYRADATHGTLATVSIAAVPTLHRDRVAARCAELLGGFQIRHSIQFTT